MTGHHVPPVVSHSWLLSVAKDCDWGASHVFTLKVEGEDMWRDVVSRALPCERLSLVVGLGPALLVATKEGRARLAAWEREPRALEDDPYVFGDSQAVDLVRAALAIVPGPVRNAVLPDTAFLAVGMGDSRAWTGAARFADRDGRALSRVVVLGPSADLQTVLHETAHVWHAETRPESQLISAQGEAALLELAARESWPEVAAVTEGLIPRGERLADAMAIAWLYSVGRRLPA